MCRQLSLGGNLVFRPSNNCIAKLLFGRKLFFAFGYSKEASETQQSDKRSRSWRPIATPSIVAQLRHSMVVLRSD
ncbi:protein of unknown function [Pararobbsia alpina]